MLSRIFGVLVVEIGTPSIFQDEVIFFIVHEVYIVVLPADRLSLRSSIQSLSVGMFGCTELCYICSYC